MPANEAPRPAGPPETRGWPLFRTTVLLLAGTAWLVWLFVDQRRAGREQELRRSGAQAQGTVSSLDERPGGNLLLLSYAFEAGGTAYSIPDRRVADFDGLRRSGPITVWYDPVDPRRCVTPNELRNPRHGWTPFLFCAVAVLVLAAAALKTHRFPPGRTDPSLED